MNKEEEELFWKRWDDPNSTYRGDETETFDLRKPEVRENAHFVFPILLLLEKLK